MTGRSRKLADLCRPRRGDVEIVINGHTLNMLLVLAADYKVKRSQRLGYWVRVPAQEELLQHDPREIGWPLDEIRKITISRPTFLFLKGIMAKALDDVLRFERQQVEPDDIFVAIDKHHCQQLKELAAGMGLLNPK